MPGLLRDKFRGVIAPLPTPFTRESGALGAIAEDGLRRNLRCLGQTRLRGFLILGSTGEFPALDFDEKLRVLDIARESVGSNKTLLFGIAGDSTASAIRLGRAAGDLGADAVLLGIPTYFSKLIDEDALAEYFVQVAENIELPVLLYSVPAFTGRALEKELVEKLAAHPRIVGLKDSGDQPERHLETMKSLNDDDFAWITGHAPSYSKAVSPRESGGLGYCGGILGVSNVLPEIACELDDALAKGDSDLAALLQQELDSLLSALKGVGLPGLKKLLELRGLYGGPPRHPLREPSDLWKNDVQKSLPSLSAVPPWEA